MLQSGASGPGLTSGHMLGHSQSNGSLSVSPTTSRFQGHRILTGQSFLESAFHSLQSPLGTLSARIGSRMQRTLFESCMDLMWTLCPSSLPSSGQARTNSSFRLQLDGTTASTYLASPSFSGFQHTPSNLLVSLLAKAFDLGVGVTACGVVGVAIFGVPLTISAEGSCS